MHIKDASESPSADREVAAVASATTGDVDRGIGEGTLKLEPFFTCMRVAFIEYIFSIRRKIHKFRKQWVAP